MRVILAHCPNSITKNLYKYIQSCIIIKNVIFNLFQTIANNIMEYYRNKKI